MGYACVCIKTARNHLFWEQGVLGKKRVSDQGSRIQAGMKMSWSPDPPPIHSLGSS
jgi:hypothetical protein